MRKFLIGCIALTTLIAGPALAADLPVKAPAYKAPPVAVFSWTGFYVGAKDMVGRILQPRCFRCPSWVQPV